MADTVTSTNSLRLGFYDTEDKNLSISYSGVKNKEDLDKDTIKEVIGELKANALAFERAPVELRSVEYVTTETTSYPLSDFDE